MHAGSTLPIGFVLLDCHLVKAPKRSLWFPPRKGLKDTVDAAVWSNVSELLQTLLIATRAGNVQEENDNEKIMKKFKRFTAL